MSGFPRRELETIAAALQHACAPGCGEMGTCRYCRARQKHGRRLAHLVRGFATRSAYDPPETPRP